MPRQGMQLSESKIYHVMIRGNERKNIFLEDEDKKSFIEILSEKIRIKNLLFMLTA